jgi:hypothetical protein
MLDRSSALVDLMHEKSESDVSLLGAFKITIRE